MNTLALFALVLVAFVIAACVGGRSSPAPNPPPGRAILFGYYGGFNDTLPQVANHASLAWVSGWNPTGSWIENASIQLAQARQYGFKAIVLNLPQAYDTNARESLREVLRSLNLQGLLENITAVYPIDEPDGAHLTDAQVLEANAAVREVMSEFPQLRDTKIAVIYTAGDERPGISSYDWVGFDDYNEGCEALGDGYERLKALLRPDQRILIVPGGADPWRQHPGCFMQRAQQDAQVVAVIPFLWIDYEHKGQNHRGIGSNGNAPIYAEAARVAAGGR